MKTQELYGCNKHLKQAVTAQKIWNRIARALLAGKKRRTKQIEGTQIT